MWAGAASWTWAGFPTVGRQLREGKPSLSRGLGEGHGAKVGPQGIRERRAGHSVGTREFQQAKEIVIVLMDTAAPWLERASRQFLGTRRFLWCGSR